MAKHYDVIVVGAGPGGMTAALYASRANLSVLMLDRGIYGGQMNNTAEIENSPGFKSILGPDLAEKMYQSSTQFDAKYAYGTVTNVTVDDEGLKTITTDSDVYETQALVIATGSEYRKLGIPGEDKYSGRGVSYCAVCDGAFFKGKPVIVVGGGDSAVEEGGYLSQMTSSVNIIHRRDQLRAQKILQDRAFANDKIDFTWNTNVIEILGDGQKVTGVLERNNKTGREEKKAINGVFIYVGNQPMTEPFRDLGVTDDKGWFVTNEKMQTKVPGILAVGDVRQKDLRQVANSVGDGAIAGQEAFNYLQTLQDKVKSD